MSKFLRSLILGLIVLGTSQAFASDFGVGAVLGDPTGVSVKYHLGSSEAIDGAIAWSSTGTHLHSNFLWQQNGFVNFNGQDFDLFFGVGARVISIRSGADKDKISFGPRAPIGLNYRFKQTPFQVFAEVALNLNLTPNSEADLDGGLGLRYHF